MEPLDLIIAAMDHLTVLDEGTISMPHWVSIVIDQDVPTVIVPYSVDAAMVEAAFKNSFLNNDSERGQTAETIPAGEYMFIDPTDEYFAVANDKRAWPLALRDVTKAEYTEREGGGTAVHIPDVKLYTHRDTDSRHVAKKSVTIIDVLVYLAAADARKRGENADGLLSLLTPYYGTYLTEEQERDVLGHLWEHKRMPIVRSGKTLTDAQGASTKQALWTFDDGVTATRAGAFDELVIKSEGGNIPIVVDAGVMMTLTQLNAIIERDNLTAGKKEVLTVSTSYDELLGMRKREVTPKNKARIRSQIDALRNARWQFTYKGSEYDIGVATARVFRRNGTLSVNLSPEFVSIVMGADAGRIPFNDRMFLIDYDKYKHAWAVGYKMHAHYYMNYNKPNRCRIGVNSILQYAKSIPTEKDVRESGRRAFTRNIMLPLQKSLDHLVDIGVIRYWKYVHSGGVELTDEELSEHMSGGVLEYEYATAKHPSCYIEWEPTKVDTLHMEARESTRKALTEKAGDD